MKKILLLISLVAFSCSKDDIQTSITQQETNQQFQDKIYNNIVFLDATYEKLNQDGNNLPVNVGDAVTIFEKTTNIKITQSTFETNTIAPTAYFKTGVTYSFAPSTKFEIYESSRIIIKKIEYSTSYGKDKRSERYSY